MNFNKEQYKKIIKLMIDNGADYAEVFFEDTRNKSMSLINKKRSKASVSENFGLSIRAIIGEKQFFKTTNDLNFDSVIELAKNLFPIENKKNKDFDFTNINNIDDSTEYENQSDKLDEDIYKLLNDSNERALKTDKRVSVVSSSFNMTTKSITLANSDGSIISEINLYNGFVISVQSKDEKLNDTSVEIMRSRKGPVEFLKELDWKKHVDIAVKDAIELLYIKNIKTGEMTTIIGNGNGGTLFHEACGHPLEASSVVLGLSPFADKIGKKVAPEIVTVYDDGTLDQKWGSSKYDDEGIERQKTVLIEKGILKTFLVDRLNSKKLKIKANGTGRRQDYEYAPTSRMSNTYIGNGKSTVEEIIKSTKKGFYAKRIGGGQVDPFSGEFNFGVTEGYIIENGEIKERVKGATLVGKGHEVLYNIDMVANDLKNEPGTCGAASGYIPVTVGQPTIRVSKMLVGGK
ncbi:MAG: TldD/PmbA family protein [Mycoplasma sp.]|nr:TldD/PmbA family protein [Mycoplasma sp.]